MNRRDFSRLALLGVPGFRTLSRAGEAAAVGTGETHGAVGSGNPGPARPRLSASYREYCFDFNWVDKLDHHVKPLSNYADLSAQNQIQDLLGMNANSLMVFSMSMSGYMFYDSKVGVRHPSLRYDYLKEMIRLGHEKGIAMELYVPTMWGDFLIQQHPSWGMRNPDGTLFTAFSGGYNPDPNSPAADWFVEVIRELIPAYGGDAFFADGITFLKYGQSEYTVSKFKQEVGRDYPASLGNDPDWRATLRWETKQVSNYWRKLRDAVKERDPQVEVTFNGPSPDIAMPGRGAWGSFVPEPPHLFPLTDYAFTEAGAGGAYADWTRGVAHPRPFRVTFNNAFSILDPFDANQVRAEIGRTLAVGGMPYRYDRTSVNGQPDRHFVESWAPLFEEVRQKLPYVTGAVPIKYVAVVSSEPSMFYRGRSDPGCHADDLIGALRMLDALHVQHEAVADWNLKPDFLRPYSLVILPNLSCISDEQAAAVRDYVHDGGTIIATAETSLFDADGNPRDDFALAEVLGIHIDEKPSNAIQTADMRKPVFINPSMSSHPLFRSLPSTELILPGDSTYVRAANGQPTAPLIADAGAVVNSPGQVTRRAAAQINSFGKGQAIYICSSLFARSAWQLGDGGVRWAGPLLEEMVRLLAPRSPWTMNGSEKIWAGLNEQPSHKRHVLHLVNWETGLSAHDVQISIADGFGVGQTATLVWPRREAVRGEARPKARIFTFREVGPHAMILFE